MYVCYDMPLLQELQKLHFPLNSNKSQLFRWSITVIKEELFSRLNVSLCKYSDSVITIDHQHLGAAVWID